MISVNEAKKIILENLIPQKIEEVSLNRALGKILAEEVKAKSPVPRFDNSAMDGYAVLASDLKEATQEKGVCLELAGEVRAGDFPQQPVSKGKAIRIMTGAQIPEGANAVVMREYTKEENGAVFVFKTVQENENIRKKAEEITEGEGALKKGALLTPASLGFLASIGIEKVFVYSPPKVTILVTGSELASSLNEIEPGQILESNSIALESALKQTGIETINIKVVEDDKELLLKTVKLALDESDCLLIVGGVSVGHWDFSKDVLDELGVEKLFWRIAQKPGKPLYCGKKDEKMVFGLPGNPASVLVCFYEYVRPYLRSIIGFSDVCLPTLRAVFKGSTTKKKGLTYFLRGEFSFSDYQPEVKLAGRQESYRLGSFAQANSIVVLPEEITEVQEGEKVEVHLLK